MTSQEIQRVDIPTLGARANYLLDLIGKRTATPDEQREFNLIQEEYDRRFYTALDLARVKEGM